MKRLASSHSFSSNSSNDGQSTTTNSSTNSHSTKRPKQKEQTSRRSSHNAIERRYRSSINDKIIELKSLVFNGNSNNKSETEKIHKAAILRSAIDTIRYLQNSNSRFEKENRSLKSILNQVKKCHSCGVEQLPIPIFGNFSAANSNADLRELLTDNSPPPTDQESSNPSTPNSIHNSEENGPAKNKSSPIALFAIAAGLFLINPGTHHPHHFEHGIKGNYCN